MKNKDNQKHCLRCGGRGFVAVSVSPYKTCSVCKGRGYIKR